MPCDSVITSTVKWAKETDPALLLEALRQAGYQVIDRGEYIQFAGRSASAGVYNKTSHTMTIKNGEGEGEEAAIKVQYSKQVVTASAKRYGWKIEGWKTNAAGNPEAIVNRRL